ncbi:hypothetical protein ACPIC8_003871 [Cronobacter sakazakii]|uniref:hypothetical protein n=1 Tax=Cronobacter sakazakii TaxID=28141 RepID=UPI0005CA2FBF|nr:hypothetical protein [Cronobacter sakazakii]EGT4433448.1 hypothetical protein [Cronobacter sakazakii]EGT4476314.1 hypothetical protein [Cronobacter sakazakii]EIX1854862.1 hypothetical protein [Cronobacter sakazakii]EIZ2463000.1 hypothetical protein [Cronobacter sakazakii]EJG0602341.1 hypothetical protein [Cronobacter sakazakii]
MKFKGTPGPWEVMNATDVFTQQGSANGSGVVCDNDDGWQVAGCFNGKTFVQGELVTLSLSEKEANARLIAAAPELLEALKSIMELQTRGYVVLGDKCTEMARAAIAKAIGEEE